MDADRISDALRRAIRQMTDMTLTSDTPMVETALSTEDVVLIVLSMDDSKSNSLLSDYSLILIHILRNLGINKFAKLPYLIPITY